MKILICGSDRGISIERYYKKYLIERGADCDIYPSRDMFIDKYENSYFNKIKLKLGLNDIYNSINLEFIKQIEISKPDVIIIFKGMEISPLTLKIIKTNNIKLVNYNPDNPFIFSGRGSGNNYIKKSIALYDFHFSYNLKIIEQLKAEFNANTSFLPFAFDISLELFNDCKKENEILKTCFLGNPDKKRADFILKLAERGIVIDVFGNNWDKYINHKNVTSHKAIYGEEQWKTLRKYRIQLNLMRIHNEDSHNMRTFEIPGIGGIQLAPSTKEHQIFFEDGKEIFLYKCLDECVSKINYLLKLTSREANKIRINARNASIDKKHSYNDRAIHVFETLKLL